MGPEPGKINLENSMDLLIALLYAPSKGGREAEPVEGITRLQKLMFLLQQDVGPKRLVDEANSYDFKPYKLGPYTDTLNDDINLLRSIGLITSKRLTYWVSDDADARTVDEPDIGRPEPDAKKVESDRFSLTDSGMVAGKDLWSSLTEKQKSEFAEFKAFFNSMSLRQLLIYTYEKFQDYATESEIKGHLGL